VTEVGSCLGRRIDKNERKGLIKQSESECEYIVIANPCLIALLRALFYKFAFSRVEQYEKKQQRLVLFLERVAPSKASVINNHWRGWRRPRERERSRFPD
jgi:hypothetical protein